MVGFDCLLLSIDLGEPLNIIYLVVDLLLSPLLRVDFPEVRGTPHLVGVELVGAAVLVAVLLLVHAVEKCIARLEAELVVEDVGLGMAHQCKPLVTKVHFNLYNIKFIIQIIH